MARKGGTSTSNFGVSRRENHDASGFYDRFTPPIVSRDDVVHPEKGLDEIFVGDSSEMHHVPDASVALVVTSPPYFAGKAYEEALGEGAIPANYFEYLEMLEAVFAECVRTLEPGGRIAVNVANLGRKPYRSLSSDIVRIFEKLQLLLRGEVIWQKARGAGGSCAWGSFQRPGNPVFRDLTERVVIASKGRFDRAVPAAKRQKEGLPYQWSLSKDEFMEATTDLWEFAPESASRVRHPAPFPVDLPARLIHLYTYYDDLVLDPFMGSGTTAVAAVRTGRHFAGYDLDPEYVAAAQARVAAERARLLAEPEDGPLTVVLPAVPPSSEVGAEDFQQRAGREGRAAKEIAEEVLRACGFTEIERDRSFSSGVEINFEARDELGNRWFFDVSGGFTSTRPGLRRTDTLWKALGKALVLGQSEAATPLVLLTTHAPLVRSAGDASLAAVTGPAPKPVRAVIEMLSESGQLQLRRFAKHGPEVDVPLD